jgi:hypothetical protein
LITFARWRRDEIRIECAGTIAGSWFVILVDEARTSSRRGS